MPYPGTIILQYDFISSFYKTLKPKHHFIRLPPSEKHSRAAHVSSEKNQSINPLFANQLLNKIKK